ncbi:hypothetical protein OSB04_029779 [Centaurea solstitialis]|uniref:Uncharacterized protein n=1 Tax=Centaurea solstitialis TaxID=347529 RepID=A0AA38SJC3_9ASTR|nr:hypothetical protein OSB04_029779 [Centaurea solstitialis]
MGGGVTKIMVVLMVVVVVAATVRSKPPTASQCHKEKVLAFNASKRIGDVKRAIRLIESCHRHVPHHYKCGSVTTP